MSAPRTTYVGATVFDGAALQDGLAVVVAGDRIETVLPEGDADAQTGVVTLDGGILCPGFVDLQVNGGGGVLFNEDQSRAGLRRMAAAHARLGATAILPTLITDTPDRTAAAIEAVTGAIGAGEPGIAGLHLEGPHLSVARKGAHDAALVRPMEAADLDLLRHAAARLPVLMVTVAPESVTPSQIAAMTEAGILVSLGHSDASFAQAQAATEAGARCVTHLFNAMSQLGNREPGLVGAALGFGGLSAGLIADGIHVHPATVRAALAAKRGPGRIFLVSDAMSVAGSDQTEFYLNGRRVLRRDGRLTLEDGTLAGADLDLLTAVRNLVAWGAAPMETALAMATSIPAALCGLDGTVGRIAPGRRADLLHLKGDLSSIMSIYQASPTA